MSGEMILLFGIALLSTGNLVSVVTLLLRKQPKHVPPVVSQPQPVQPSIADAIKTAQAQRAALLGQEVVSFPAVTCIKCHRSVARFTVAADGNICANCQPMATK